MTENTFEAFVEGQDRIYDKFRGLAVSVKRKCLK